MELSLMRAPLRRRPNAEPNDGFPPTAADFRTIQDGPQSTLCGRSAWREIECLLQPSEFLAWPTLALPREFILPVERSDTA